MKTCIASGLVMVTAFCGQCLAQTATEPALQPRTEQTQNAQEAQNATNRTTQQPASQAGQQRQAGQSANLDQQIAACALLTNQEQVALAKFAAEKAEHADVKKFAQMLVEQHQQAVSKIEQAVPQLASMKLTLRNAEGDAQPAADDQQAGAMDRQLQMARQIKEECLAITKKALSEKQGADFDKAFVGQQVMAHMGMLAGIKGSEPFVSPQMKPWLQECMKTTEEHLTKAKELMEKVKDQDAPRQARAGQ